MLQALHSGIIRQGSTRSWAETVTTKLLTLWLFGQIDLSFLRTTVSLDKEFKKDVTGAPNENFVQNHLNIALLNVFLIVFKR